MSQPITIEDIYKLFEQTNERFEKSQQEHDRREAEATRREAEAARRAAEAAEDANRREAEAARREAEVARRVAKAAEEAARREAEAARSLAELKKTVDRTTKAVEALTTRWGRFVEELVEPAVIDLFRSRGLDVKETYSRAKVKRKGLAMEIDILVVDDTEVVLVECKSRLSKDDVDEFLEKLTRFKQAFPHYENYQAYGAVAGIEIDQGVDKYAYRKGLFVIKPSGDTVTIVNDDTFQGKFW